MLGAASATLAACGKTTSRPASILRVGSTATGAPFSFLDIKSNKLTGAMIDIAQAVAKQAGLQIEIETTAFAALVPSLTADKIDIVSAGILRTAEREKVVAFTQPVYAYGGGVMVRGDYARTVADLSALRGVSVGAQVGTRFVEQLAKAGVEGGKTYDNLNDAVRDLKSGRIQAVYGDAPLLSYRLRATPDLPARLVEGFTPPSKEDVCLLVRKGDAALLSKLNEAIAAIKSTQISAILSHWGLS